MRRRAGPKQQPESRLNSIQTPSAPEGTNSVRNTVIGQDQFKFCEFDYGNHRIETLKDVKTTKSQQHKTNSTPFTETENLKFLDFQKIQFLNWETIKILL